MTPAIVAARLALRNAPHGCRAQARRAYEAAVRRELEIEVLYDPRKDSHDSYYEAISEQRRDLLARKGEGEG